jgi:hypothetical protein
MAQKKVYDFGRELARMSVSFDEYADHMIETQQKVRQAQELMTLINIGRMTAIQQLGGKKIEHALLENRPAEKIEPAPGKRKIVL